MASDVKIRFRSFLPGAGFDSSGNPELIRHHNRKRRARKLNQLGFMPNNTEQLLWDHQEGRCYYCETRLPDERSLYHLEHLMSLSKGGLHDIENVCLSCASCNAKKHTLNAIEFFKLIGRL